MIKTATWLMMASLISSFMLIPAKSASAATVYKYEWVSQSGTVSPDGYAHQYTGLVAGQTLNLSLTLINRSGTTIIGKGALPTTPGYQVPIGTWGVGTQNPQDGTPYFLYSSSFVLNNNRFVYYDGPDVPNGGYFTLNWTVKLTTNLSDGVYDLYYRPVCEYLAWTRQYKNGRTLPGTNSDIFTRFVVGSGNPKNATEQIAENRTIKISNMTTGRVLTYQSDEYGFAFNYKEPISPAALNDTGDIADTGWIQIRILHYGIPEKGMTWGDVLVYRSQNLDEVINQAIDSSIKYSNPAYTRENLHMNGLDFVVFKYISLGIANLPTEQRFTKLPSGWVVSVMSYDWWLDATDKDYTILDSLRAI